MQEGHEAIETGNARLMCESLYVRLEKEIVRLKKIASKRKGVEKQFVTDLIQRLEQEKLEYQRSGQII